MPTIIFHLHCVHSNYCLLCNVTNILRPMVNNKMCVQQWVFLWPLLTIHDSPSSVGTIMCEIRRSYLWITAAVHIKQCSVAPHSSFMVIFNQKIFPCDNCLSWWYCVIVDSVFLSSITSFYYFIDYFCDKRMSRAHYHSPCCLDWTHRRWNIFNRKSLKEANASSKNPETGVLECGAL